MGKPTAFPFDCRAFGPFSFHFLSLAQACLARPKNENCRFAAAVERVAETEGFEPSIPFRGIHTFQACSFNHSDKSPLKGSKNKDNSVREVSGFRWFRYLILNPLNDLNYLNFSSPSLNPFSSVTTWYIGW